ncbi:MAG: hypothetical protein ACP5PT_02015 [Brevinematia bacterium]
MSLKNTLKNLLGKIKHNAGLKLISFIIAVVLWFYLKNLIISSYEFYIPLNYENLPPKGIILNANSLPNYVLLKLKGDKKKISEFLSLPKNSIYAVVDLSNSIGKNKYKVKIFYPYEDKSISIEYFPSDVFVDIDYLTNIVVPVEILNSSNYVSIPNNVVVTLPSRNVDEFRRIEVLANTNLEVYELPLLGNYFIKYYPEKLIISNTNKKAF